MPRLLLLVPTTTYRTEAFVDAALALGVELVIGSDRDSSLQPLLPERYLTLDLTDPQQAAARARDYARSRPLDAVLGVDDETVLAAAGIAEALGLRGNPLAAARATRDKLQMRRMLAAAGLPGPVFRGLSADDDPRSAAEQAEYPVVLKATALGASRGVIRADDPAAFVAAFSRIVRLLDDEPGAPRELLVESFLPGREVALEGLLRRGTLHVLALFDKPDPLDGPYFEETIYLTPSRLPAAVQQAVADQTARAATALGLVRGPVHAELRVGPGGPVLLELAARTIGGRCSRILRFGAGLSLEELVLRHALDLELPSLQREPQPAGVMMIPIPGAGRLRCVRGLEAARAVPGIEDVSISAHLGQQLVPLPEGRHYLGFIFARADTVDEVEQALRAAHGALEFTLDSPCTTRSS